MAAATTSRENLSAALYNPLDHRAPLRMVRGRSPTGAASVGSLRERGVLRANSASWMRESPNKVDAAPNGTCNAFVRVFEHRCASSQRLLRLGSNLSPDPRALRLQSCSRDHAVFDHSLGHWRCSLRRQTLAAFSGA